jgi:hypothetical protein
MKLLGVLFMICLTASGANEHLFPVVETITEISKTYKPIGYHELVFERLFKGQPRAELFLLEIPSFQRERLLVLHKEGDKYLLRLRRPAKHIWPQPNDSDARRIETIIEPLDSRIANRLINLWHNELHRTGWSGEEPKDWLDGVQYYLGGTFLHDGWRAPHHMIGEIQCPDEFSRLGVTVQIASLIMRYLEFPTALKRCSTPEQRIQWIKDVVDNNTKLDWMIVLSGEDAYWNDPFLKDPWAVIEAQVALAETMAK